MTVLTTIYWPSLRTCLVLAQMMGKRGLFVPETLALQVIEQPTYLSEHSRTLEPVKDPSRSNEESVLKTLTQYIAT